VPHLNDISTMLRLIGQMGVEVTMDGNDGLVLDSRGPEQSVAPYDMVKTMRASILVLGPLVARLARPGVAARRLRHRRAAGRPAHQGPAGDGRRDHVEHGYVHAKAPRLKGARIVTDMVTVTGTENLMMAAALADGETSSRTPRASRRWSIWPTAWSRWARRSPAPAPTASHPRRRAPARRDASIMPDRIETGTYLCAAAATGGKVR
jgi:UDP-N-acetylglucosamine 1-carboxyvinyltransferase